MTNNFKQISKLLEFTSEDDFYFVQILKRKKDQPEAVKGSNNSSRLIKAYYINSVQHLLDLEEEMIFFAEHFNARVGINLNKRSYYKTAFNTLKKIAEQMHNKNFKNVKRAWATSCGLHNANEDKKWILDIDVGDTLIDWQKTPGLIKECINSAKPEGEKILAEIPTKSGVHLITKPFDPRTLKAFYPDIEIHKNNPVNLWIP